MSTPGVSVVIPNYNGRELLQANLPHVRHMLRASSISDAEVIVCDDASQDDSVAWLRSHCRDVRVVAGDCNLGFSGNANRGIRAAIKDLVLLLNSDVELTPEYLVHQVAYFQRSDTFGVMGRIDSGDGSLHRGGAKYPRVGFASIRSTGNYVFESAALRDHLSFYLSGANALMDRKKLVELGGFCELFNPYYSEDVDLCLRAWRLGYRCYYEPRSVCRHASSVTIRKQPRDRVRVTALRNKLLLHHIHLDGARRSLHASRQIAKALVLAALGRSLQWRAWCEFLKIRDDADRVREDLARLQSVHGVAMGIRDVQRTILESLRGCAVRRF